MDAIYLNGLEFYAYHGVFSEENRLGQRFFCDAVLYTSLERAGLTDDLQHTVNYGEAYDLIKSIMAGPPVQLLETLAERIAALLLDRYPAVQRVRIKITKPMPPIPGPMTGVAVEIERGRG
ncbi:MAG: dihydroneopterin aldolase [Tumebacillaceae bacterium]